MGVLRTLAVQYNPLTFSHILAFGWASFHFYQVVPDRRECCASFATGDGYRIDKNETSSLKIEIRKSWQEIYHTEIQNISQEITGASVLRIEFHLGTDRD